MKQSKKKKLGKYSLKLPLITNIIFAFYVFSLNNYEVFTLHFSFTVVLFTAIYFVVIWFSSLMPTLYTAQMYISTEQQPFY